MVCCCSADASPTCSVLAGCSASASAILTGASLVAGTRDDGTTLLIARALQGAGAALIAPAALSMVMALFAARPAELRKALGFWGASAAAGGTAGVFLGGVITEWLSWRWTFLINVPVGVLVLLATNAWLPRGTRQRGQRRHRGRCDGDLGARARGLRDRHRERAATAGADRRAARDQRRAVRRVRARSSALRKRRSCRSSIFRAPNLTIGNIVMALLGAAWIPMWFFLNMYLQEVLGYGAFESGLALLPMTLAIMLLMMMATEKVVGRIGPKSALVIGLGVLGVALVLFARMPVDGSFVANVLAAVAARRDRHVARVHPGDDHVDDATARPEDGGLASGLVNTTYQVGSAIGLAAMVAVAGSKTSSLALDGRRARPAR